MKAVCMVVLAWLLAGCGTAKLPEAGLDYGPKPTSWEPEVRAFMEGVLKDPFSAQYKFEEPFPGYTREIPAAGAKIRNVGWVVRFHVNAKNSYGGYTGFREYQVLMREGRVLGLVARNPYFSEPWLKGAF